MGKIVCMMVFIYFMSDYIVGFIVFFEVMMVVYCNYCYIFLL